MTVSLHDLIEEWEAINYDLYKASLESHRRYPFPTNLFNSDPPAGLTSRSTILSSDSSTAAYARVYHLISRVRYIAEDARYNSFGILQHLLWVTIVAWTNQMAIASGGLIALPASVRQHGTQTWCSADGVSNGAADASTSLHAPFPCALLPPLTFWDPNVLAEAAGGGGSSPLNDAAGSSASCGTESNPNASVHRAPSLRSVWADAVQRVMSIWCTPAAPLSSGDNPFSHSGACTSGSARGGGASTAHLNDAYAWVVLAQHYHRFKAILSLFFLRYNTHLEELEEQQRRLGLRPSSQQQQQHPSRAEAGDLPSSIPAVYPSAPAPLRRRGPHFRMPSDASSTSAGAPPSTVAAAARTAAMNGSTNTRGDAPPPQDRRTPHQTAAATPSGPSVSAPLPTTARLLALIMRSIELENIRAITAAAGEAVIFLLVPPPHRALLREKVAKAQQRQQASDDAETATAAPPPSTAAAAGNSASDAPTEREWMPSAFLDGCAVEDEDEDKVVWSSPPSPLLSFTKPATLAPGVSLTLVDEHPSPGDVDGVNVAGALVRATPSALGRAQKEEYVIRNVFKLLLMAEDCRVYALQHWLVEAGKHVVAVYGSQLASLFFEESPSAVTTSIQASGVGADNNTNNSNSRSIQNPAAPVLTVHTLADANRVLRETIQSYVRLRTKLLFLNAGTTHFLEALTPWGRTRMLENLNAFLCGFCGVTLPPASAAGGETATAATHDASPSSSTFDAAQYFTPTNAAVAAFARTWAVPLWLAMCEDTQHRLETLQELKQKRERQHRAEGAAKSDDGNDSAPKPQTSPSGQYRKERAEVDDAGGASVDRAEQRSGTEGPATSVASVDLGDAVSCTTSGVWPPSSPTAAAVGRVVAYAGRGVARRRVLQQHQRQRVPFDPQQQQQRVRAANAASSDGGGGGLEESLYSAETASMDETSLLFAAAAANTRAEGGDGNANNGRAAAANGAGGAGVNGGTAAVPASSIEAAVAAARQRRRQAAAAAQDQRTILVAPGTTPRFSRAAQLHQVATLPDEGFPSLMYLMPRRSRFIALDKAAAAVQQELFTRFSSDVHNYLTRYLEDCEAAEGGAAAMGPNVTADSTVVSGAGQKKTSKRKIHGAATDGDVCPLPQRVLARMIFLLDMTYAALQGSGIADSQHGHTNGPLMETGLTVTGQELGAAILEQDNGEYESVVSTTLSAPTSPAVLTIAAVRKGFQGFLAVQERRAVLTLAQALYSLIQQGIAHQPPMVSFESVDTILNMASLLNSKDVFVSLMKGYIAPQVMMCRSLDDAAVESQVVARMAYRLGSAVAAPCLTLLRDLRLAISDPLSTVSRPLSLPNDGEDGLRDGGGGMTAEGSQLVATRDAQTLAAAGPLRHGLFGLIHRMRVLCQAWWQPHTAVLLSSRKLQRLWEQYQLLDERVIDAVLRVEWSYEGHTEPFPGYGSERLRGGYPSYQQQRYHPSPHSTSRSGGKRGSATSSANVRRGGTAVAVIQGFSSALGNAVRRSGGTFGNNESDNESEDYSEAYGGLLTLNTLQQHRGVYATSNSSYRGSNVSSMGGGGGTRDYWDTSDGNQSTVPDEATSTTVPPDGERERRQLRWPLGDGKLVFLVHPKGTTTTVALQAVQISGPPLTLMVCQLMDRAVGDPYTFDRLHKALPVQAPKPLLAHLLHELVKAGVVTRSVPAGTRQYAYQLRDDVQHLPQRKVVLDVHTAAQQHWVSRTLAAAESDAEEDADQASQRDSMSPASLAGANPSSPSHAALRSDDAGVSGAQTSSEATAEQNSPTCSAERMHKIKVCIVRIMKSERVLPHRELQERVAAALEDQFVVTSSQLKRCIAHLIENEFLQRSEGGEEYMYLS